MKSKYKPRLDSQTSTVYFPLYTDAVRNIEKTADPYRICGFSSAENRTRTDDPFITSEVLYQLSYFGTAIKRTFNSIAHYEIYFNSFFEKNPQIFHQTFSASIMGNFVKIQ